TRTTCLACGRVGAVGAEAGVGVDKHVDLSLVCATLRQATTVDLLEQWCTTDHAGLEAVGSGAQALGGALAPCLHVQTSVAHSLLEDTRGGHDHQGGDVTET